MSKYQLTRHVAKFLLVAAVVSAGAAVASGNPAGGHGGGHGHGDTFAFGRPGKAVAVTRTIELTATDNRFNLENIAVVAGETIRFVIRNDGDFLHEFNIGTPAMHRAHQEAMLEMVASGVMTATGIDMSKMATASGGGHMMAEMKHDDPNAVLIEPGQAKEIIWTFAAADRVEFACNVPGHYESGMMGSMKITRGNDTYS